MRLSFPFKHFSIQYFLLWVLLVSSFAPIFAEEKKPDKEQVCLQCEKDRVKLNHLEKTLEAQSELLGKNRVYLLSLDPKSVSKVIKVESNIMLILQKADSLRKEMAQLETTMQARGCSSCQTIIKD